MKRDILIGSILVSCFFAQGLVAIGQTGHEEAATADSSAKSSSEESNQEPSKYSGKYGKHLEPILQRIKATEDQRKQLSAVVEDFRPRIEPLREKYRQTRTKFLEEISSSDCSDRVMVTQMEMGHLDSSIRREYLIMRLKVRKILTPEQDKKFEAYRNEQGWK